MGRYVKSVPVVKKAKIVKLAWSPGQTNFNTTHRNTDGRSILDVVLAQLVSFISFKVFKAIIMISAAVVPQASIVVIFPEILTNFFSYPKLYRYFSEKKTEANVA